MSSKILYSTARTHNGQLIQAIDAEKGQPYECLICNQILVLRKGQRKRPHFAHKVLSANCSPETALHHSFKTLLCEKIQEHLDRQSSLKIEWDCSYCHRKHEGNLLKKAIEVRLEYEIGDCQPDIALLDPSSKVVAVIEVVVTHSPEEKTLNYYTKNQIAVVRYKLRTDEDLQRLDNSVLEPDQVSLCVNPKCPDCKQYMSIKRLLIMDAPCWKCLAPMTIAALRGDAGYIDLNGFSESEIQIATKKGVYLATNYSRTVKETYISNTCPRCSAFIGNHYLFNNYVAVLDYLRESIEVGYYCPACL